MADWLFDIGSYAWLIVKPPNRSISEPAVCKADISRLARKPSTSPTATCTEMAPISDGVSKLALTWGAKVSVTSWIWVTDWNSEMARPTPRLVNRMGADTLATTTIICTAISITAVSVMWSGALRRSWGRRQDAAQGETADESQAGGSG